MAETSVKQELLRAIERLPDDATLDDVARLVKLHEMLARGRADSSAGRVLSSDQMRERTASSVRVDWTNVAIGSACERQSLTVPTTSPIFRVPAE
jgi:hypothetical protein